jgi:hypothetical protein
VIFCDGSKLTSTYYLLVWLVEQRIELALIQPGEPMQNTQVGSFSRAMVETAFERELDRKSVGNDGKGRSREEGVQPGSGRTAAWVTRRRQSSLWKWEANSIPFAPLLGTMRLLLSRSQLAACSHLDSNRDEPNRALTDGSWVASREDTEARRDCGLSNTIQSRNFFPRKVFYQWQQKSEEGLPNPPSRDSKSV